jgi:hypothetical protein
LSVTLFDHRDLKQERKDAKVKSKDAKGAGENRIGDLFYFASIPFPSRP